MKKKILIIEDEETLIKVINEKLGRLPFDILNARDGVKGLELALKEKPDLILLDIIMPKMNGLEVLKALRKDVWGATASIIILTNLNDDQSLDEAKKLGVHDYWVKSALHIDDVSKMVRLRLE